MPRIILAPNALKGSCTAAAAAAAMARGSARALPEVELVELPVADGGDGLAEVLTAALDGSGAASRSRSRTTHQWAHRQAHRRGHPRAA